MKISSSYISNDVYVEKTFIRLMLLGSLAFASFFVFISSQKDQEPVNTECTGSDTKKSTANLRGEFILEGIVGSVLLGTN